MTSSDAEIAVVGPREPCPCGSGKRYKACHGKRRKEQNAPYIARPFEGLPHEGDWVAMREIVPSATATIQTTAEYGSKELTLATVLPMAWAGAHRDDGKMLVATQTMSSSGDASRDIAAAILSVIESEEGAPTADVGLPGPGPRLQDILDLSVPFEVEVHDNFDFWISAGTEETEEIRESLERAREAIIVTVKVDSAESAYWCRIGEKEFLRWVQPHPEEELLDALARLHAERKSALEPGSKLIGAFRTGGLVIPVWELAPGTEATELDDVVQEFKDRLDKALTITEPLNAEERRARAGLVSRQVTLR